MTLPHRDRPHEVRTVILDDGQSGIGLVEPWSYDMYSGPFKIERIKGTARNHTPIALTLLHWHSWRSANEFTTRHSF